MKHTYHHAARVAVLLVLLAFAFLPSGGNASPAAAPLPQGDPPTPDLSAPTAAPPEPVTMEALRQQAGGEVYVATRKGTGVASLIRVEPGQDLLPIERAEPQDKAVGFLRRFGRLFGIANPATELLQTDRRSDFAGIETFTYSQVYRGLPVFGGVLHAHIDQNNQLRAVNGVFVPDIRIDTNPRLTAQQAAERARADVRANPPAYDWENGAAAPVLDNLTVRSSTLLVYRDGLIQNVPGPDYLAYQVEVTNGADVREFLFIDAQSGKLINRYSAINDALFRRLFEQNTSNQVWQEGDPFPGSLNGDQQNIVNFSGNAYHFFSNAFGRDSYNAAGAEMRSVNNDPRISCPNANWNGATTNYCNGVTSDDVVAHEWGHAFTEYTANLIYQWQSGALNESYSDVWGEVVDLLNGAGTDAPGGVRSDNACSLYTGPIPTLTVNAPPAIAGDYAAAGASFGPAVTAAGTTGAVALADDGAASGSDACTPLVNGGAVAGKLALVDRGTCAFTVKVKNAQNAGAIGVIVANNVGGPPTGMGGADPTITIPSVMVSLATGNLLKANLAAGVNATMRLGAGVPREASYRWLIGEDSTAFGGAIRDMWNPTCASDPGAVLDDQYQCAATDGGGVHTNSGVTNHGFAMLVDGGSYNGQTVGAIGVTKAAHIFWRALSTYETPVTDFADHADALAASCQDLKGANLPGLGTGGTPPGPSGEVITDADCAAVDAMIAATELRQEPVQCNFQPILAKNPPALCAGTNSNPVTAFSDNFEGGLGNWIRTNQGVFAGWPGINWEQTTSLPGSRAGAAAFGADPNAGNCDADGGDISGAMFMESPEITIPSDAGSFTRLAFDHYVATESGYDGGNLKISINGGPYTTVPASAFIYNPYNLTLQTAASGNTDPLAGQPAFSGTDGGKLTGSWGQSQINLSALGVQGGDKVRLRYDNGMDGCTGNDGWYVDDLSVYACVAPTVTVAAGGQCLADNSGSVTLSLSDSAAGALQVTATSSNQALVPNGNIVFSGSGATRTMRVTAASNQSGTATVTVNVTDGNGNVTSTTIQVIVGTNQADSLNGASGADIVFSMNANDTINGGDGNDLICAGNGDDTASGGAGDDTIDGQNGNDMLSGGDGKDSLRGNNGNDTLTGGAGPDQFTGGSGSDTATDFNAGEGDTSNSVP